MTKEETYDTHVYVEGRQRPLRVGMHTDENSEICSIRFGNSFTLNVVTPQDLIALAQELDTFAKRAYELHYEGRDDLVGEEMARIQEILELHGGRSSPPDVVELENLRGWLAATAEAEDTLGFTVKEEDDVRPTKVTTIETPDGILTCHEPYDPEDTVARTMAEETMMKGTVPVAAWKDPSDPVNW